VLIPDAPGLAGHSDADVVSHALADALLGAARLGDLGELFPPTERWRDVSGLEILRETATRIGRDGWVVSNVDVTVVCERPRVAPWRAEMVKRTAGALSMEESAVSIKGTSTDGMGFTGRGEGAAALAVVLVEEPSDPQVTGA
jgi:2-C-methyl-D-erythritol 2,4-cyclodiphosphate synthase